MDRGVVATLIEGFRHAPIDTLMQISLVSIGDRLPQEYFATLDSDQDRLDVLRACLIVSILTDGRVVPRVFQLKAALAMLHRRDCVIIAGTGTGKTICLLIPLLLRPDSMSITISPLKRLQITQVNESESYGIKTIAINEDTPHDEHLWKCIRDGKYQHLIVSPEQLGSHNGHLPRLARLVRDNRSFVQKISYINVDEAHNIHIAGLAHHGEPPFRPAYSQLGSLRIFLAKDTPIQVLSATLPHHILATVKNQLALSSNLLELRLPTNRPNIMYATIPIIGNLRNFDNLSFLIPTTFHPPMVIPKTLVFHDSKQEATDAVAFIESRLPRCLRNRGLVKHYHSDMSIQYLQQTFEDFSQPDGACRILHATAGAATGLDIQGVLIVIQYGVCKNMAEAVQRAGRAARNPGSSGLFVTMVEKWALDLPLNTSGPNGVSDSDPDKPYVGVLKKNSSKQDRTSIASLQFVQSQTCLRARFADYLGDGSPEALHFTALCCDRHDATNFDLSRFFHGKLYTGTISQVGPHNNPDSNTTKRRRNQMRTMNERQILLDHIMDWCEHAHKQDLFFSSTWILNDNSLELVTKTHPEKLRSLQDLVVLLGETEDWGMEYGVELFEIINQFDHNIATLRGGLSQSHHESSRQCTSSNIRPAKRARGDITFVTIQTPESFAASMS